MSKAYIEVGGRPLLAYTLDRFQKHPLINEIVLIIRDEDRDYIQRDIVRKYGFTKVSSLVEGGEERQESVYKGLKSLDEAAEWVVIHDAVRPLLSEQTLTSAIEAALAFDGSVIVGVPAKDTIKLVDKNLLVLDTPARESLWQVQTPQIFRRDVLLGAHQEAEKQCWQVTDDASLLEKIGLPVHMVKGEYSNIKVTTPEDLLYIKEVIKVGT